MSTRKGRAAASAYLVEGPHAIGEALRSGHPVRELFVTEAAARRELDLLRLAAAAGAAVCQVSEPVMARLGDTVTPQGVVAVVEATGRDLAHVLTPGIRLAVVLAGVADPGNVGTVIRSADAFGADVVAVSAGSVDVHSGKCLRASAGSFFHLPVVTAPLTELLDALAAAGVALWATAADGADDLDQLADDGALVGPVAWMFGSEAHGLPPEARARADRTVRIALAGGAESLNLAAAAAVCLHASAAARIRSQR